MGQPLPPHRLLSLLSANSSLQVAACTNKVALHCAGCCGASLSVHSSHGCQVPCRCAIQLTVLGYILEPVFAFDAWWLVVIICICMLLIAAAEAVSHPTAAYQVTAPAACCVGFDPEAACPSAIVGLLLCICHQAAFVPWGCYHLECLSLRHDLLNCFDCADHHICYSMSSALWESAQLPCSPTPSCSLCTPPTSCRLSTPSQSW